MPASASNSYRQIADALTRDILSGRLRPGERVPGEQALMEQYGVARETARRALAAVAEQWLIETRQGSGTYVRQAGLIRRRGTKRLARSQWGAGHSIWAVDIQDRALETDRIEVGEQDCPEHVAAAFGLEPGGRVVVRDRRYVVDGTPVMTARSYLPAELAAGTRIAEENTGPGGTYARLEELGHGPVWFRETLRIRMPMPEEAEELRLGKGVPVGLLVRYAWSEAGRLVEVNEMTLDASRFVLEWEFPA